MFHKNLNIIKVTQLKSIKKLKKVIFSLIIETKYSKKINKIIFKKLLNKDSNKNAIIFVKRNAK